MTGHPDDQRPPRRGLHALAGHLRTLGPAGHVAPSAGHFSTLTRFLRRAEQTSPENPPSMMRSTARVTTPRAERYAKQLCSHAARMTPRAEWNPPHGVIEFPDATGTCHLVAELDQLVLTLEATGAANLVRLQQIVGGNIERFGQRECLTVAWVHN